MREKKRLMVLSQILNLVLAILAFSFLIALSSESVSGGEVLGFDELGRLTIDGRLAPQQPSGGAGATIVAPKIPIATLAPPMKVLANPFQVTIPEGGQATVSQVYQGEGGVWLSNIGKNGAPVDVTKSLADKGINPSELPNVAAAGSSYNQGMLAQMLGTTPGGLASGLLTGLQWAVVVGGLAYMVGSFFGMDANNQKALALAMGGGTFVWQFIVSYKWLAEITLPKGLTMGQAAPFIGIGVAAAIFIFMYKKTSASTVTFECKPYEPPTGGAYCELCNKDKFRPCSEYRCRSLGQACEIRPGKDGDTCVWVNPNDVTSPTIGPWTDVLLKGYSYKDVRTRPPGTGMKVVRDSASDGCVKAFTPLTFGINTNEPTQCKIDYNHTVNIRDVKNAYDSMAYYFGELNTYDYNHSQTLRLPGPAALAAQNISPEISLDGTYTLYVRCQDANGNVNEDEFAIRFCVEKGPDTTPPKIEGTSIASGMPVSFNTNDTELEVYINEPADCRWSKLDKDYEQMENPMTCDRNVWEINTNMLYKCRTTLTGLENRKDNQFYFRCKDQPYVDNPNDRISNSESYSFVIKGSQPLNIKTNSIKPNGTIQGFANVVSVDLTLETENGWNGKGDAICYYSNSPADSSYIMMFDTGTNKHKQNQQLPAGTYTYYYKCVDLGGNADYGNNTFTIEIDKSAPQVTRIYNEGSNLKVETDEKSTCYYSENSNQKCNYALSEGKQLLYANATAHYMEWKTSNNLYIKCADSSGNQPNPLDCSIIVRAYNQK